jgi:hypothetical protein
VGGNYFGAAGGAPEATRTRWNEIFRSLLYNNEMVWISWSTANYGTPLTGRPLDE